LLSKFGKLLLSAYILKRLDSGNSHKVADVSEHKKNGMVSKYGKLILGAYLMKRFRVGRYYGTLTHEEGTGGLLNKYGKLMLTTYALKRLHSRKSHKKTEYYEEMEPPAHHGSFLPHLVMKYGKWLLGVYLMRKFHHKEPEAEVTEMAETEAYEEDEGSSTFKFNTIIVGALAGMAAIYAIKRYRAKHCCGYEIDVE